MISGIEGNNLITDTILKIAGKGFFKNPPTENSIVLLKAFEKVDNGFKLLINGDIFIAKLPIQVKTGETLLGKVISSNPLVIGLDNFVHLKFIDQQFAAGLVEKLGLKPDKINIDLVSKLLSGKKALLKSKIEDIIEITETDYTLTEMQMGMLINLLWSSEYTNKNELYNEIKIIKEIPFDKLCNDIFRSIIRLNNLNLPIEIYNRIKECFFINVNENNSPFDNRINKIIGLVNYLEDYAEKFKALKTESEEIKTFTYKIIQYILQKSIYFNFNFYPDFYVIFNKKELDLIIYSIEILEGSKGANYFKLDLRCGKDNSFIGGINGYYSGKGMSGKLTVPEMLNYNIKEQFEKILHTLAYQTGLFLNISVEQGYQSSELMYKLKTDILNFKA
ncbi:MAG TPA: hypothetical protein PL041_04470 [Melioribacteraceae bacterium]|nr:hypothetical protein [Melioribacteraceae bacterium]